MYYRIWVDAINYERNKYGHIRNWKTYTLIPISTLHGLNLFTLLFWMNALFNLKINIFFDINIFPGTMLDSFFSSFITLFLPFLVLNYLLIFHKKKYEKLLEKYDYENGKLYLKYFMFSAGACIIPILIAKIVS